MQMTEKLEALRRINPEYFDFLVQWQGIVLYLVFGFIGVGVVIWLLYQIKTASIKDFKAKYDHISKVEDVRLYMMHVCFAIALALFINYLEWETVAKNLVWFFVRLFIGVAIAILYGYVAKLLLKFYWPKQMHKKLRKLRYTPRVNPATGNKMKLLSEEEEDVYLDEGQQAEENVFSVDYDVWIDEETMETHIEKYDGRLSAEECDRCGFQTLRLANEKIVKQATGDEDGELEKEFKCSYCSRVKRRKVKISRTMDRDLSNAKMIEDPLAHDERVVLVKIDIKSTRYNLLSYEFKNIKEALKSEGLQGEGYGIEEIKVEIFTHDDEHLKFEFQNLPEMQNFLRQFDVHSINE